MREPSRDKGRLEHILQAIERIKRYTLNTSFEDFIANDMMYYRHRRKHIPTETGLALKVPKDSKPYRRGDTAVTASVATSVGTAVSNKVSGKKTTKKSAKGASGASKVVKSATSAATRTVTRELTRSILGNLIK